MSREGRERAARMKKRKAAAGKAIVVGLTVLAGALIAWQI